MVSLTGKPGSVNSMKLMVNRLDEQQHAVATDEIETIPCDLVLRSIGYRSIQADPDIPFDSSKGLVPNSSGVVSPGKSVSFFYGNLKKKGKMDIFHQDVSGFSCT